MTARTVGNLLRVLTPRRVAAAVLARVSSIVSIWTGRVWVAGAPFSITIEPTNHCNLRCPECPSGLGRLTRPLGSMDGASFESIIRQVAPRSFWLNLYFQGEPFINRELLSFIDIAHRHRMYVAISSNAHLITHEVALRLRAANLERLIISIDGLTDASYEAYRVGGSLARVHAALEALDQARIGHPASRMEIVLQFLITRHNEDQIPALRALARRHGASVALKTIQVHSIEGAREFLPTSERHRRYRIVDGELRTKSAQKNRCVALWERSIITWDGTLTPCCFDKDARYPVGHLPTTSFQEAWTSPAFHAFRTRILTGRRDVDMCRNCTEGLKIYR